MVLVYNFGDALTRKREQEEAQVETSAQKEAFKPLQRQGLLTIARSACEDFTKKHKIQNSHHIENAYLLALSHIIGNRHQDQNIDGIIKGMNENLLRSVINIKHHGKEYLKNTKSSATEPSEALYCAAIAYMAIRAKNDFTFYSPLIGQEACNLADQHYTFYEDPQEFHSPQTPAEARLLHLSILKQNISSMNDALYDEFKKHSAINRQMIDKARLMTSTIDWIDPKPQRSEIERKVYERARSVEELINQHDQNISFDNQQSPDL